MKPKRLTYDIETAFNIGGYFGPSYDVQIGKVIQKGFVLGFAYKWGHQKKIHTCYIWDFPLYKKDPRNDIEVVKVWAKLMTETDYVIGQNNVQFDDKVMYGRLIIHGLPPIPMPQQVDTKKMAKRVAKFDSYKLDDMAESFGYGNKLKTDVDLWWNCMMGDKKAQKRMETYNKRDVEITEKTYLRLLPYDKQHPNLANIANRPQACPKCLTEGKMWAQGIRYTKTGQYRRFQCLNCGSYFSERNQMKGDRPQYV